MTRGRTVLILLIPVEILILFWLGSTFREYPHRLLTRRKHDIAGWIWQDVPLRVDGSWRFLKANGTLTCQWELGVNNYSRSDTVRLSEVIYILRDRHGAEIARERHAVYQDAQSGRLPSHPAREIGPGQTLLVRHVFPIETDRATLVAQAHIELAAELK